MHIHHLYIDEQGESHFADLEVGREDFPATAISFHDMPTRDVGWHPSTRRQYVIFLEAGRQVSGSDGETRSIGPGEVVLAEDTFGKGHLTRSLGGAVGHVIWVPID